MKKAFSILLSLVFIFSLASCATKNKEIYRVEECDGSFVIENYTNEFSGFTEIKCEQYYTTWETTRSVTAIGPVEPGYRALLTLTEDKVNDMNDKYEWTEVSNPAFTFEIIEIGDKEGDTWYTCKSFEDDTFKTVAINNVYFNGKDTLVFDIQTT